MKCSLRSAVLVHRMPVESAFQRVVSHQEVRIARKGLRERMKEVVLCADDSQLEPERQGHAGALEAGKSVRVRGACVAGEVRGESRVGGWKISRLNAHDDAEIALRKASGNGCCADMADLG